jgi:hypothetical protein
MKTRNFKAMGAAVALLLGMGGFFLGTGFRSRRNVGSLASRH